MKETIGSGSIRANSKTDVCLRLSTDDRCTSHLEIISYNQRKWYEFDHVMFLLFKLITWFLQQYVCQLHMNPNCCFPILYPSIKSEMTAFNKHQADLSFPRSCTSTLPSPHLADANVLNVNNKDRMSCHFLLPHCFPHIGVVAKLDWAKHRN